MANERVAHLRSAVAHDGAYHSARRLSFELEGVGYFEVAKRYVFTLFIAILSL